MKSVLSKSKQTIFDKETSTALKLCGARQGQENRPAGTSWLMGQGLCGPPQAKGGAGLLRGESYQVFMETSMEPPVKLLVPGMNRWLHEAPGEPSQHWLPTWLDLFLPEEREQDKGRTEGGQRREHWWRSRWAKFGPVCPFNKLCALVSMV